MINKINNTAVDGGPETDSGPLMRSIRTRLEDEFSASGVSVVNESHMHSGPATESHFKVTVVTEQFASDSRVKRHQRVYALLADEMKAGVHALALHLYTPGEWQERQQAPNSPACRGGSKTE